MRGGIRKRLNRDPNSAAGRWLLEHGADAADLNVYASYRGNWEVMLRGMFANKSVRNLTGEDTEPVWERTARFRASSTPTVIVAGERYGMGSSRDWAAKGTALLGVRAVLARSFERIHRTNLIGMGILPIEIPPEMDPMQRGYQSDDRIEILLDPQAIAPKGVVPLVVRTNNSGEMRVLARLAVETMGEIRNLQHGGLIQMILSEIQIGVRKAET